MLPPEYRQDEEAEILPAVDYEFYLGVLQLIQTGTLDRYLIRLQSAIKSRQNDLPDPIVGAPEYEGRHRVVSE